MKSMIMCATVFGLVTLGACNKKSENPPPGPASGAVATAPTTPIDAPPPPPADAAGAAAAAVDVPTEMDFEADAAKKITDKNVEAQVKAIEADLEPQK
jgi:hypothetical protein